MMKMIICIFSRKTPLDKSLFKNKKVWNDETGSYRNNPYLQGQKYLKTVFKQQRSGGNNYYDEFI